jgi:predicted ester cyclase
MWSKPDLGLADEIIDPNYDPDWVHIDMKGPAQVKHEIKYFRSVFPDLLYKIVEIKGENDKVWIRYKGKGTHKGNAWGFEPTNKEVEFSGATILYINSEGKIIDRWGAFCFYDILVELKVVPSLWELNKHLNWSNV